MDIFHHCKKGKRFGSDDLRTRNIRRYSTVFIPHLSILLFLGGYHDYSCAQSNEEVWAFSFLTNCCQQWPSMLISQKRKHATSCPSSKIHVTLIGERYIVAIASDQQNHQNQKFDLKLWKWTQISNPPNHYHDDHRNQKDIAAVVASPCCRYLFLLYESNPTYPYDYYYSSSSSLSSSQSVAGYSYHVDMDVWFSLPPTEEESNIVVGMNTSTIIYHDKILLIGGIIPCSYNSNNDDDDEYYNEDYTNLDNVSVLDLQVNENYQNDDTTCTSPSTMLSIPNLPIPVRGASSCIYDGTLTVLGGLSSFSSEIYTNQSSTVWQLHCDANEVAQWKIHPSIRLPHAALLNGLCFSIVL